MVKCILEKESLANIEEGVGGALNSAVELGLSELSCNITEPANFFILLFPSHDRNTVERNSHFETSELFFADSFFGSGFFTTTTSPQSFILLQ